MMVFGDDTLMDELVEGMLPIGSWLAPDNWPSVVVYTCPVVSDVFSIWLHVTLDNKHNVSVVASVAKLPYACNSLWWVTRV